MKPSEIRDMSTEEIRGRLEQLREEQFRLRFRSATQVIENPMLIRQIRRDVARLNTVLAERARTEEASR